MANPRHRSVLLDHQMIVDGVSMQEKIDWTLTSNYETGLEKTHGSRMRVIGERSYKQFHLDCNQNPGPERIETDMSDQEVQNFKNEWEVKSPTLDRIWIQCLDTEDIEDFMANPRHRSVLLDHQMIVDGVLIQEKKDWTKIQNDETGVEESHLSHLRILGNRSFTAKRSGTCQHYWLMYQEEMIETEMNDIELENFKNEWDTLLNPLFREWDILWDYFIDSDDST